MSRRTLLLLQLVLLASCEPSLKESLLSGPSAATVTTSTTLTPPPASCTSCALAPTTFTRTDGRTPQVREFTGDPQADYLLIVQDDGQEGTGAEIKLNGETVVAKTALVGFGVAEIKLSVTLKASNRLTVLPVGKVGAKVVVWILGGAATIGPTGGQVRAPGGEAVLTIPARAVSVPTQMQIVSESGLVPPGITTGTSLGRSYRLEPDGLSFPVPIVLTLDYLALLGGLPPGAGPSEIGAVHWNLQGTTAEVVSAVNDSAAHTLSVALDHFSLVSPVHRGPNGWATFNLKWSIPTVTWYLVPPAGATFLSTNVIQAELSEWESQTGGIHFQMAASKAAANLVFVDRDLSSDACPLLFSLKATGPGLIGETCFNFVATFFKSNLGSGDYATIYLDSKAFSSQAAASETIRHEIGHALGIAHPWIYTTVFPPNPQLVPVMQQGYSARTGLDRMDIAAVQYLYGTPIASVPAWCNQNLDFVNGSIPSGWSEDPSQGWTGLNNNRFESTSATQPVRLDVTGPLPPSVRTVEIQYDGNTAASANPGNGGQGRVISFLTASGQQQSVEMQEMNDRYGAGLMSFRAQRDWPPWPISTNNYSIFDIAHLGSFPYGMYHYDAVIRDDPSRPTDALVTWTVTQGVNQIGSTITQPLYNFRIGSAQSFSFGVGAGGALPAYVTSLKITCQ